MILNEATTILTKSKIAQSKLQSIKDHMENLLRKKIRIESEINELKRILVKKKKLFEKQIKESLDLEPDQVLSESQARELEILFPDLNDSLQMLDQVFLEIEELEERFTEDI